MIMTNWNLKHLNNPQDLEHDIDPVNNFFSSINDNCRYYTDEQYNGNSNTNGKLSRIHFNSRSMYANFTKIKEYLCQYTQPFNIIGISETWISSDKGVDFDLEGYEFMYINRQNKGGGGVALCVDKTLKFSMVVDMSGVTMCLNG